MARPFLAIAFLSSATEGACSFRWLSTEATVEGLRYEVEPIEIDAEACARVQPGMLGAWGLMPSRRFGLPAAAQALQTSSSLWARS